ncbi:MAG: hypothetical protein ABSC94_12170 [Polyangiaceae bacterium]|jgi:hypothetical protein
MIRSWSGQVAAPGQTRRQDGRLVIHGLDLAGDMFAWFGGAIPTFDWALRAHALDQVLPLPVSDDGARYLEASPLEAFTAFGHVAACACTTWAPGPPPRPLRSTSDLLHFSSRVAQIPGYRMRMASGSSTPSRKPIAPSSWPGCSHWGSSSKAARTMPEHIHRQVRVKCLQRGVLVRDYILELLAKDGIK